jgi:serine/threonine-protein kinase RsbW
MSVSDHPRFHLAIGSRFENIELVQAVLADALENQAVDTETRHWIDIAVREAVANAIKHGNRLAEDKQVAVDLEVKDGELVVRVEDEGAGFDPAGLGDPLAPENRLRPNGRGIFYMQRFMDSVDYDFRPEGGTVVTLKKRVTSTPADAS